MGTGMSKKPRKKLRPPLPPPPQFSIDTPPWFFPGSRSWDPAETLSSQFPLGHAPTETLKRELRRMEHIRDRQEAFFPGVKADRNFDRSREGRAATPKQVKGAVQRYIEWLKIELSLRREKRPLSGTSRNTVAVPEAPKGPDQAKRQLKPKRGRPSDPDVAKRRAIVSRFPKYPALKLCREFDDVKLPLPWTTGLWDPRCTWEAAYKSDRRGSIDKMISVDRKVLRKASH